MIFCEFSWIFTASNFKNMIQRIQTLWLLFAAACAGLTFKFPIYAGGTWNNSRHVQVQGIAFNAWYPSKSVLAVTVVIIVLSLIALVMYKSRGKQMFLTVLNLLVSLGLIYLYYSKIQVSFVGGTLALTSVFVLLIPIFLLLAMRGIYHDMRLLRKADRLRD